MRSRRRMLREGEELAVDVRPHWWYLAGPVSVLALVTAGAITALVAGVPSWVDWLAVAAIVAAALWLLGRYIRWASTRLMVTSTRIIERRGILARNGREIPLGAITDIGYRQTIFERIIGTGDVVIESAGRDGQEVFPDLPHPGDIHNEIYARMDMWRRGGAPGFPAPGPPLASANPRGADPASSIPEQIRQLDQLRQMGILTEAEFAAKKAELLDRL